MATSSNQIFVHVDTDDSGLHAHALAQFFSGVAIMRSAISLSMTGDRGRYSSRLSALRSPLLWAPATTVEMCGYAWNLLGDWPPMDPVIRSAMRQGVLEACDPREGPDVVSINDKCLEIVLRDLKDAIVGPLVRFFGATKKLMEGDSDRAWVKNEMMSILEVEHENVEPARRGRRVEALGLGRLGLSNRSPRMLAAGAAMFGCQSIESAYDMLGAKDITASVRASTKAPKHKST
jgi:hypothetical protein